MKSLGRGSSFTSRSPPWRPANMGGMPANGSDKSPRAPTIRNRPGRSVSRNRPSGRKASAHGGSRPTATLSRAAPVWVSTALGLQRSQSPNQRLWKLMTNANRQIVREIDLPHRNGEYYCGTVNQHSGFLNERRGEKKVNNAPSTLLTLDHVILLGRPTFRIHGFLVH